MSALSLTTLKIHKGCSKFASFHSGLGVGLRGGEGGGGGGKNQAALLIL